MSVGKTLWKITSESESGLHTRSQSATVPLDVVFRERQQQQTEAPRVTTANLVSALKSIDRRWEELSTELRFPQTVVQEIGRQNFSHRERLTAVIKHFLQLHPFASWRRIIRALERLEEHSIVKRIKMYAEHILDPSLTADNVTRVILATKGNWADGVYAYGLAGELLVPITIQEKIKKQYVSIEDQKVALAKYWLKIVFNASWPTLIGALYYRNEEDALNLCMKIYSYQDKDESLTFNNLLAAFEGVTKWEEIGYRLRIPTIKQNEIRVSYKTDEQRKEAILKEFVEFHPAPTWREAALALYRMRYHELVKDLYEKKYLIAPEEQRLLDIFNFTIKRKGYLYQTIMQATIQGNARSGKTSLIKVLQGKTANPVEPSTAVMKESARIELDQSAVLIDGVVWTSIEDLHEEANLVMREVMTAEQIQNDESSADDGYISTDSIGLSTYEPDTSEVITTSNLQVATTSSSVESHSLHLDTLERDLESPTISNIFKLAIKKAKLETTMIKDPWTLYISDVGGQLEFQELVPALTNGPSLHIIVIAAHWGLNNKCPVEYLHKNGESAVSYKANYTVKENVLLTLATIMSTGRYRQNPKAMFVMTFKDLVKEEELLQMDKELLFTVKSTQAYRSGVIEVSERDTLCHFINNLEPDKADISRIRKTVERIGKQNDSYRVRTPYTWLCFSLALRGMKEKVLPYSTCVEIGKQCEIDTFEELDAALHFLHYNIGVIRHFSDVPDLKDIIIKEPQLLFDCVTELVVNTFTFEKVTYSLHEDFQKKGLFPAEIVNKVFTNSDILTVEKFIAFLMHHHMVAPLIEDGEIVKYFLPCSLVHAKINEEYFADSNVLPSLIVTFTTGYTPRGIFGFLVSDLLTDKGHELQVVLDVDCIYRDQLTVSVGPYVDKFSFSLHPMYIKIDALPSDIKRKFPFGVICCYVRKRVTDALEEIVERLNYNSKTTSHSLAFFCPGECSSTNHPAIVSFYQKEVQAMKCTVSKTAKSLPEGHEVWFNETAKYTSVKLKRSVPDFQLEYPEPKRPGCDCEPSYDNQKNFSMNEQFYEKETTQGILKVSDLQKIRIAIWKARSEWKAIGNGLHVDAIILRSIAIKHQYNTDDCFTEMLYNWLCQEHPLPTLNALKRSLRSVLNLNEFVPALEKELDKCLPQDTEAFTTSTYTHLSNKHLKLLVDTLWDARVKWFDIGLALLNDVPSLESIKMRHHCNPDDCLQAMLSTWLEKGDCTLEHVRESVHALPVRETCPEVERKLLESWNLSY